MGSENGGRRTPFAVTTRSWGSAGTTLTIVGELDIARLDALRRAVQAVLAGGHRQLVIDLSATSFIDCAALHELLEAVRPLHDQADAAVVFAGAAGAPRRLLEVLGFDAVIGTVASPETAVAACQRRPITLPDAWRRTRAVRRRLPGEPPVVGDREG